MADTALKLVLLGDDRTASKSLKGVGHEAGKTQGKLSKLGSLGKSAMLGIAGVALAAGAAAVKFGGDSLKAFADADKSQRQLTDAYKRFPKVQNVSIEAMRKYNQELQRKTGADADDLASSQAVLAQFKLNGKQIKSMTPLLIDYANKTGKSLPDAAKTLGKATLGSGKALKELGINFKDTKDPAKNLQQVMDGLQEKVGGYTESLPEAERKQKILQASFGDLQESIGEKLQPAMIGLVDAGQGVLDWLDKNPKVMKGAQAAADLLGEGLKGIWFVVANFVAPAIAWYLRMQVGFIKGTADMVDALNQVPIIGDMIPDDAGDKLRDMADGVNAVADGLDSLNDQPNQWDIDTTKADKKTKAIDTKIAKLNKQKIKMQTDGDTKGVDKIESKIRALQKKKKNIKVGVGFGPLGKQKFTVVNRGGKTNALRFTASGHPSLPSGGLTMVGDGMGHSPEALELPAGTKVLSYGQTSAAAARSSGTAAVVNNYYTTVQGDTNPQAAARKIQQLNARAARTYGPGWKPPRGR